MDNASEHALNDFWNAESEVALTEEWIPDLEDQPPRMILLGKRSTCKVQKTTRPDTICPKNGPDHEINKSKRRLQPRKRPDCKKLAEEENSSTSRPEMRNCTQMLAET